MQGNTRRAGRQCLAVPLHATHERDAETGLLGRKLRTGRVVIQPGGGRQHGSLGSVCLVLFH
jgi:hypothetical protein